MATANFNTSRAALSGFPLYAREYATYTGKDGEEHYSEFDEAYLTDCTAQAIYELNRKLDFFKVGQVGGYYSGVQLIVKHRDDIFDYCEMPEDYAEVSKSRLKERVKLAKELEELASIYGFERFQVAARFSNGEALYEKVEARHAEIKPELIEKAM